MVYVTAKFFLKKIFNFNDETDVCCEENISFSESLYLRSLTFNKLVGLCFLGRDTGSLMERNLYVEALDVLQPIQIVRSILTSL